MTTSYKKSLTESTERQVDAALKITDLLTEPSARFDVVVGTLDGPHGRFINKISDKAYFILQGQGTVFVGGESIEVKANDLVHIPPQTPHGIKGTLKFMIISSPPFSPENETIVDALT